jgi:hypothetical protein
MIPYPYNKAQLDLLYKLINEANPGAPFSIDLTTAKVATPQAQAVVAGQIADTNVMLTGKGYYIGGQRVQYRRIDLTKFFRGVTVKFDTWSSNGYVNAQMVVDHLNKTYGLAITINDISIPGGLWAAGTSSVNTSGTSLCYIGSITWTWSQGKREIESVLLANNVDGRLFPGGNVFDGLRKPQGEYICYDLDFAPVASGFASFTATGVWPAAGGPSDIVFPFLKEKVSSLFDSTKPHTEVGGLVGATYAYITALPSAIAPEANAANFPRAVVITAAANSWWQGKIMFHFKV